MTGSIPLFICQLPLIEAPTVAEREFYQNVYEFDALTDNLVAFVQPEMLPETERLLHLIREAREVNAIKFGLLMAKNIGGSFRR